jgi:hypothetical protein
MNYYISWQIENYTKLCSITVDLSHMRLTSMKKLTGEGIYYRLDVDIVLLFGLTELKAQIAWKEGVGDISYIARRY